MVDRKRELKEKYKQMKQEMGIYIVRCNSNGKCYIGSTPNLKGKINSTRFSLELGSHPNKELQKEVQSIGKDAFTIEVLDILEYDKDETKTDYTEDLEILKEIWKDKISGSKYL
ncbi:hypothetical protein J2Z76_000573 [Sedimentibacter acidaminivorans]|jgi:GIY-YIG catalytic domain-containing protein|uniref:GIY-YIG domain-containing protein n=1 Tax=Sedimentibacter acidaminivorans TaxID=913099 RepID=A0ABS4GBE1_9FIRM|nr:GIY-YIG nuclease family protein [Sedimentibacter acidaminivorans]MBP1924720.1 hypothetical protein [Sedimentibacter acidaminivorans]